MAKKVVVLTDKAPAPVGPYSQAIRLGDMLFCSGQIAIDPKSNEVLKGSVQEQTELVLKNIAALLENQGLNFSNIVKTTIFLTDMNDFAKVNEIYAKRFTGEPPARSTVQVSGLPKGVNVEIEVIAHY
jgi:2-iminobutanoate/2-iminopropanoate deaminase